MKKRLLFTILTALMVLPGCNAKLQKENFKFIEDTDAHEEIFGEAEQLKLEEVKEAPTFLTVSEPAIGVQSQISGDNIHIRFVAAVQIGGKLSDAPAVWKRRMFNSDGSIWKDEGEGQPCDKVYTSLKNGGSTLTIADFNTAHGTSYNYFVVYTMLNIPKETYKNCYLNAYVTVNDGESLNSKVLATTVDQKTQLSFELSKDKTGYFGVKKTVSAGQASFSTFDANEHALAGNYARFVNVSLNKDESFVLVNSADDYFAVHGYEKVHLGDTSDETFDKDGDSDFAVALANGSHFFYLSSGGSTQNYIYHTDANKTKTFYFTPASNWKNDNAWFALNAQDNDGSGNYSNSRFYGMTDDGTGKYMCDLVFNDLSKTMLIFCRMDQYKHDLAWASKNNQSGDIEGADVVNYNYYTQPADTWDGWSGTWDTVL